MHRRVLLEMHAHGACKRLEIHCLSCMLACTVAQSCQWLRSCQLAAAALRCFSPNLIARSAGQVWRSHYMCATYSRLACLALYAGVHLLICCSLWLHPSMHGQRHAAAPHWHQAASLHCGAPTRPAPSVAASTRAARNSGGPRSAGRVEFWGAPRRGPRETLGGLQATGGHRVARKAREGCAPWSGACMRGPRQALLCAGRSAVHCW